MNRHLGIIVVVTLTGAGLLSQGSVGATDYFEVKGTVQIGSPLTRSAGGVTKVGSPCQEFSPLQGTDGYWIELPEESAGARATLSFQIPNDLDAWFYDTDCRQLPYAGMARDGQSVSVWPPINLCWAGMWPLCIPGPGEGGVDIEILPPQEQGTIPAQAHWVAVDLRVGSRVDFSFRIDMTLRDQIARGAASSTESSLVVWDESWSGSIKASFVGRAGNVGLPLEVCGCGYVPAVAYGNGLYLIAWVGYLESTGEEGLLARRLSSDGVWLDAEPFLAITSIRQPDLLSLPQEPQLAFNGSDFILVWTDYRTEYSEEPPGSWISTYQTVKGARVSNEGTVLDPGGFQVSTEIDSWMPVVAASSEGALAAWFRVASNGEGCPCDVVHRTISDTGELGPEHVSATNAALPGLASDGQRYLLTWLDLTNYSSYNWNLPMWGQLITQNGDQIGEQILLASSVPITSEWQIPVVANAGGFVVGWHTFAADQTAEVRAARLDSQGTLLDPGGILLSAAASHQSIPIAAWDGTNFLFSWSDARLQNRVGWEIYGTRLSPEGIVLDDDGLDIGGRAPSPAPWRPAGLMIP